LHSSFCDDIAGIFAKNTRRKIKKLLYILNIGKIQTQWRFTTFLPSFYSANIAALPLEKTEDLSCKKRPCQITWSGLSQRDVFGSR